MSVRMSATPEVDAANFYAVSLREHQLAVHGWLCEEALHTRGLDSDTQTAYTRVRETRAATEAARLRWDAIRWADTPVDPHDDLPPLVARVEPIARQQLDRVVTPRLEEMAAVSQVIPMTPGQLGSAMEEHRLPTQYARWNRRDERGDTP